MSALDGWDLDDDIVVEETHLSRKPTPGGAPIAIGSIAVLLLFSLLYWSDLFELRSWLPASREAVFARGEYWRLVTTMFIHADVQHFLSNAVVLGVLAFLIHGYYGAGVYPWGMIAVGTLVTGIAIDSYPARTHLVGASGLVYAMAGFWLSLYLLIERRFGPGKRLFRAIGFGFIVLVPTVIEPDVSYRTHFIGFVTGAVAGVVYFQKHKERLRSAERLKGSVAVSTPRRIH